MPLLERSILTAPRGYRAQEAALCVAQLEDQSERLRVDTRGLTPAALAWQPRPGTNSIGMLLAHIAIVEVFWTMTGLQRMKTYDMMPVLGIGVDDDGMPCPRNGRHPATLRGWTLRDYDRLLERARRYSSGVILTLRPRDLARAFTRTRRDRARQRLNVRWVLYHMVEHEAGHYGQINLLRHLWRSRARGAS